MTGFVFGMQTAVVYAAADAAIDRYEIFFMRIARIPHVTWCQQPGCDNKTGSLMISHPSFLQLVDYLILPLSIAT
jgi:hypothetical protein